MRVAHLDTGRDWRGGQAQVLLLMRGLRARGHASLLLAPPAPLLERARADGFETVAWRALGEWDLWAARAAARALGRGRAELVHCHTARAHAAGAMAGRLAGLPVVVSRRVALGARRDPLSRLKYLAGADRYLCVSRSAMEAMERAGIPRARLALVPSGIEIESAPAAGPAPAGTRPGAAPESSLRELIGAPANARVVGTVASLSREKNHHDILEAAAPIAARLPDVHFAWIGEGGRRAALERRRAALGLAGRVHLLGFRADARQLMAQLTLLVLASSHEGIGTVLLEAQALGVPVIASAVGGVPEVVEDGITGRLVPPHDPAALARALGQALKDPALSAAWAARARTSVRAFSAERMVERTLEQYRDLVERRARAPRSGSIGTPVRLLH